MKGCDFEEKQRINEPKLCHNLLNFVLLDSNIVSLAIEYEVKFIGVF